MSSALALNRALPNPIGWGTWFRQMIPGMTSAWDGFLMAVPKKKTTHAKKRMRMTNKYLRPNQNVRRCPQCGTWKLAHTYCTPKCPGRAEE